MQQNGHSIDAEVLRVLSPYRREHINRLGDYLLDLTIDFAFKPAA
nr:Tn3 family transposase [Trinickia dabaoshanensis]